MAGYGDEEPTMPVWQLNLGCTGLESNITECQVNTWSAHGTDHSNDAEMICYNNALLGRRNFYYYICFRNKSKKKPEETTTIIT